MFKVLWDLYAITAECEREKHLKIDQHLPKLG